MPKGLVARAEVVVDAPVVKVWDALMDPEMIKKYMFGAEVKTSWKEGEPITYEGMWNGEPFEDKGKIIRVEPEKLLVMTHWSPLSGTADEPDNYHTVGYELAEEDGKTRITLEQDNNSNEDEKKHSEENWEMMLNALKGLVEADI